MVNVSFWKIRLSLSPVYPYIGFYRPTSWDSTYNGLYYFWVIHLFVYLIPIVCTSFGLVEVNIDLVNANWYLEKLARLSPLFDISEIHQGFDTCHFDAINQCLLVTKTLSKRCSCIFDFVGAFLIPFFRADLRKASTLAVDWFLALNNHTVRFGKTQSSPERRGSYPHDPTRYGSCGIQNCQSPTFGPIVRLPRLWVNA